MFYREIPNNILEHITIDEATFNSLDEQTRIYIYEGALRKYEKIQNSTELSLYLQSGSNDSYDGDYLSSLYDKHVYRSNMGIITNTYYLKHNLQMPSVYEFIYLIRHIVRLDHPTNVTFTFINQNDVFYHVSFNRNDLKRYSLEELVSMLSRPTEEWFDDIYSGSDYVLDLMRHYTLNRSMFSVTFSYISGGYGKMLPDYYETLGIESNDNNCLMRCMFHFTGKEENNKYGIVDINDVHRLEKMFGIHVDIYRDQRIIDIEHKRVKSPNISYIDSFTSIIVKDEDVLIYGSGQSPYKILYKDNHYDVILKRYSAKDCHCPHTGKFIGYKHKSSKREILLRIKEQFLHDMENLSQTSSEDMPDTYFFFDYETVFDPKTFEIIPYVASICKCHLDGGIIETRFFIGSDVDKMFIDYLMQQSSSKQYLIGYNNSRFDNYLLLKSMMKYNMYVGHVRFAGTSIISINANGYIVRDLCRILNCSLDEACKSFGIQEGKTTLRHEDYQFAYLNGELNKYCQQHYDELYNYSIRDVTCLSELFFSSKKAIEELTGLSIENFYTLAGLSFKAFINTLNNTNRLPVLKKEYKPFDEFVRMAIIGGRAQVEEAEVNNIVAIDCVSLYPYVMLNREYPIGYPETSYHYVNNKIGIYKVVIQSQQLLKYNVVPKRGTPHDWSYKDKLECVLSSVDIECLRRHGCRVDVQYGIYWKESVNNLFDAYFKPIIHEKQRQDELKKTHTHTYNAVIRETCKLLLNSLSGKLIERIHNQLKVLCQNAADIDRFFSITVKGSQKLVPLYNTYIAEGQIDGKPKVPSIFGVLIYAYARSHMYDNVISKVDKLYGTDTDSAFISRSDFQLLNKNIIGNDFGQFKIEHQHVEAIFVAPKCYIFYKYNNIIKARFKGIDIHKDKLVDEEDIHKSPLDLYHLYHQLPNIDIIQLYRKMLKQRIIHVLSNNISKRIIHHDQSLYLSNHIYVKTIKLEHEIQIIQ